MKEQIVEIKIQQLEANGKGSGTFIDSAGNQKEAEVAFCMPGDLIEAAVKRKRQGVFPGRLLHILTPSPERKLPRCVHFGACGGCSWQEVPYAMQLAVKEQSVQRLFGELLTSSVEMRPILGGQTPWGYRNKMEFSFSQDKKGSRYLGLFLAEGRGKVFNLQECHLVSPWFAETLQKVRTWWESTSLLAYHPPSNRGTLRTLTLREGITSGDRMAILTVSGNPEFAIPHQAVEQFRALFENCSVFLRIHQAIKGQPTEFFEMHLKGPEVIRETFTIKLDAERPPSSIHFGISPAAFFQPNTGQAERLYTEALQLATLSSHDVVYDLFCGTGTLGLLASRFVKQVIGVEISPEATLDARTNAKENGIENIEIVTGDVGSILSEKGRYPKPSLILLDPPRSGLDAKALQEVLDLQSPKIVYISCNPATQARDIQLLVAAGYQLTVVQPVDQFPQTPHIENIAVLIKPLIAQSGSNASKFQFSSSEDIN